MTDGIAHEVDVIIYGTGFQASNFLTPMKVIGRDGVDLHEQWDGDARAYLGVTIPGFPNLFCLYGPNTNIVINGSIIYFSRVRRPLHPRAASSCCCRTRRRDDRGRAATCTTSSTSASTPRTGRWRGAGPTSTAGTRTSKGRVAQNWPFTLLEYWQRTKMPNPDDYVLS